MNTPATKPTTLTDKVIAIALVVWLLFFGGFGQLKTWLSPSKTASVVQTIGQGAQQLLTTAQVAAPSAAALDTRAIATPARAAAPAAASRPLLAPAAAPAAPAARATVAPAPTLTPAIEAKAPASQPAAIAYSVPAGAHTEINPDGSFTVDNGGFRYYPNSEGVIVEVRIVDRTFEPDVAAEGAPADQKIFLDASNPTDAAYLQTIPTASPSSITPCAARHGCPKP